MIKEDVHMFKKCLSLALVLILLIAASSAAADEKTRIVFWHSMSENNGEVLEASIAEFNAGAGSTLGIEVESVYQGSYHDSVTKMNSMISAGDFDSLPDVMVMDATGKVVYSEAPSAVTVSAMVEKDPDFALDDYLPSALANWNLSGVQLGLPFATSTTVTYYNKTVLDAYGITAPDTLQDIASMAEKLAGSDLIIYACVPNTPYLANWLGQLGSYLVDQSNGTTGTAVRLDCIENGTLSAFLQVWKDLYASGALMNASASSDEFAAGKLLIYNSSSSGIASMLGKIGENFELGVSAYPRVHGDASFGATVSGSCLVAFDHGAERLEAAKALMLYLTGAAVQADFAMKTGYVPSCQSALESETWKAFVTANPVYAAAAEQLSLTPPEMRSVTVGPAADFYYAIMNDITDMLDQGMTAEETAEWMNEDLGGMLEQYAKANP